MNVYKIVAIDIDGVKFEQTYDSYMVAYYRYKKLRELDLGFKITLLKVTELM